MANSSRNIILPVNVESVPIDPTDTRPHCMVIGSGARELVGFRGPLTTSIVAEGYRVSTAAAEQTDAEIAWYNDKGIHYYELPLQRTGTNPFADLTFYNFLCRLFGQLKPDVFLFYTHKPMIYGTLAAKKMGLKNVNALLPGLGYGFSGAGGVRNRIAFAALKVLHKRSKNYIDNLFFVNVNDYDDFKDHNLIGRDTCIEILPGEGKDVKHYDLREPPENNVFRFNLITRLLEEKGVRDFVEASRQLREKYRNVEFDLLGPYDTNPNGISPEDIERWTRDELIVYHGQVDDVRPFYEACHATILPTTYREGLPNVLLEAMAMGRPIITYRNAGCTQTIESPVQVEPGLFRGTNGFLIEPKRVDLIVKAMEFLIENPEQVGLMGAAGRKFVCNQFDVDSINDTILRRIGIRQAKRCDGNECA